MGRKKIIYIVTRSCTSCTSCMSIFSRGICVDLQIFIRLQEIWWSSRCNGEKFRKIIFNFDLFSCSPFAVHVAKWRDFTIVVNC